MDFEKISSELNNKNIVAILDQKSHSYEKFGPRFIGKLVGRTKNQCGSISKNIVSITILSHEYLTYNIPCEDIKRIAEKII